MVRTSYNPLVQWSFICMPAQGAMHLPSAEAHECRAHAQRAIGYATEHTHDGRTLFLAAELRARLELLPRSAGSSEINRCIVLVQELGRRQVLKPRHLSSLSGYFVEDAAGSDAYRSIAFNAEPAFALLRVWELRVHFAFAALAEQARDAVMAYAEHYLLSDNTSNPFRLTPSV